MDAGPRAGPARPQRVLLGEAVRGLVGSFYVCFFERGEFLIATSPPKKLCVCSTNLGFSVEKNVRVFD